MLKTGRYTTETKAINREISIARKQPKIINTRQFKHYNIEAYKQDLAKVLQNQPQDDNPNTLWKEWKENGYDRISPKLLKDSAEIIAESLSYFQ